MKSALVLLLPAMSGILVSLSILWLWIWWRRRTRKLEHRRHPLKTPLLRPPGYSTGKQAEDALMEAMAGVLMAFTIPVLVVAIHATQTAYAGASESVVRIAISVLAASVALAYSIHKLLKEMRRRRDYRLGWEGELAVAENLQSLWGKGFRVYHDVPAMGFNIDHVVVGPTGVYAIETKTRTKRGAGPDSHRVKFDGKRLIFPTQTTDQPVRQAQANAQWLSKFLTSAVGTPIKAAAVVCLPGWWIDRGARSDVAILSGAECWKFFVTAAQHQALGEQQIQMVAHQLDSRCRDVALAENLI